MKIVAIIQARMGSTRLPGKVLRSLGGCTVLERIARSAGAAPALDSVCIATSEAAQDDAVAQCAAELGVACFRGSEDDVLARFHGAAAAVAADAVVRITADCPLFDGALLEVMLQRFIQLNSPAITVDYLSNTLRRTYPRGLDAEIFTRQALDLAVLEAQTTFQREHVTPYFYQTPERIRLHSFEAAVDHSQNRWTLDTPEDWEFVEALVAKLPEAGPWPHEQILAVLAAHPELAVINAHVAQKTH